MEGSGELALRGGGEVGTGGRPYCLSHRLLGVEEGIQDWDIEAPYTLESELVEGQVTDRELTALGSGRSP